MTLQGWKLTVSETNQKPGQDYIFGLLRRPLKLRIYPDSILRDKAAPVKLFDRLLEEFAAEMLNFMRCHRGIGLAAPQVGIKRRIIGADIGENPVSIVNPEIVAASDWDFMTEGCLSLPGVNVDIQRMSYLELRGQNPQGKDIHIKSDGLQARVLQHEIDHLNGVLICDYDNQFMQKDKYVVKHGDHMGVQDH